MSKFEMNRPVGTEDIKRAKYKVKNAQGEYEIVYLETSVDQVEGLEAEMNKKADSATVNENFQTVGKEIDAVEVLAAGLRTDLGKAQADIVANAGAISKETTDRQEAVAGVQGNVDKVAQDLANEVVRATGVEADLAARITAVEGEVGTDLGDLRDQVEANTSAIGVNAGAITKEVSDRKVEITRVEGLVATEEGRALAAEKVLQDAINTKTSQVDFVAEQERVNGALGLKADKTALNQAISDLNGEIGKKANSVDVDNSLALKADKLQVTEDIAAALAEAKSHSNSNLDAAKSYTDLEVGKVAGRVGVLEGKMTVAEADIVALKSAVEGKNSNTLVFATMEEFHGATLSPKVGDLAFVLDVKKAFIFKGGEAQALELPAPPTGWVYFDEISTEVDLAAYAKIADVQAADSALDGKITAEKNRAEGVEAGLQSGVNANSTAISKEVSDREVAVSGVQSNVNALETKVGSNMTVIGSVMPNGTLAGHVWLDLN